MFPLQIYVHAANHAGYYPGAAPISLKLLFSPADARVLGCQATGTVEGVEKRVDVIATIMQASCCLNASQLYVSSARGRVWRSVIATIMQVRCIGKGWLIKACGIVPFASPANTGPRPFACCAVCPDVALGSVAFRHCSDLA